MKHFIRIWEDYTNMYDVNIVQVVGTNHASTGKSEDAILITENDQFLCLGIADGKSGCRFGKEGGQIALKAVFDYITTKKDLFTKCEMHEYEAKSEIFKIVREELERQAASLSTSIKELASTLVVMIIDKVTGEYLICHLGDGCILGINKENISFISTPKNGITQKYTWTTASSRAAENISIKRYSNIKLYSTIYLMSDGCECFHQGIYIPFRGKEVLLSAEKVQLEKNM